MNLSRKKTRRRRHKKRQGGKTKFKGGKTKKQMVNCSVANEDHIPNSCFPKSVVDQIQTEYNKDHPQNPVSETDPHKILEIIMKKNGCGNKDERCLLGEIDDIGLRKKYLKMLFAPNHPDSWIKNPDEWLTNIDIDDFFEHLERKYGDFKALKSTPIDFDTKVGFQCVEEELCNFSLKTNMSGGKTRFGAVFNLDKHDQAGSHWVSLYISVPDEAIVFFDSALGGIPKEIDVFVKRVQKQATDAGKLLNFSTNKVEHQKGNTECGMYSIYFITEMLSNFKNLNKFIEGNIPDDDVFKLRGVLFNSSE
jgi:hypothetical protein